MVLYAHRWPDSAVQVRCTGWYICTCTSTCTPCSIVVYIPIPYIPIAYLVTLSVIGCTSATSGRISVSSHMSWSYHTEVYSNHHMNSIACVHVMVHMVHMEHSVLMCTMMEPWWSVHQWTYHGGHPGVWCRGGYMYVLYYMLPATIDISVTVPCWSCWYTVSNLTCPWIVGRYMVGWHHGWEYQGQHVYVQHVVHQLPWSVQHRWYHKLTLPPLYLLGSMTYSTIWTVTLTQCYLLP